MLTSIATDQIIIQPADRVRGIVSMPGDKSVSHRSIILGAMARGITTVDNFLMSADCLSTLRCLRQLGVNITVDDRHIEIRGRGLAGLNEAEDILDCGNSGTTMRLLTGLLAGCPFLSVLNGDHSLRQRPMARIIDPLRMMGADISARDQNRRAPICIRGASLHAIEYLLPVASAQIKSALLLAGLMARGRHTIIEPTPSRDHTERMLPLFGVDLQRDGNRIILDPNRELTAHHITVPGDISSAAYFLAMGCLLSDSEITITDVGVNPTRTGILDALSMMQADFRLTNQRVISNEPVADIVVRSSRLQAIELEGNIIPRLIDELPIIAVLASQAEGTTRVRDAGELRVKETDRIKAIVTELRKMGADIVGTPDGMVINGPTSLHGAECISYDDHRIAMALSVAGLMADEPTIIRQPACIRISFPDFFDRLETVAPGSILREPNPTIPGSVG